MEFEADKLELRTNVTVQEEKDYEEIVFPSGRIVRCRTHERHLVIFTHNGSEKVRIVRTLAETCFSEKLARELLLGQFGIVADEIIQIG